MAGWFILAWLANHEDDESREANSTAIAIVLLIPGLVLFVPYFAWMAARTAGFGRFWSAVVVTDCLLFVAATGLLAGFWWGIVAAAAAGTACLVLIGILGRLKVTST